jgi:hypothetical protein
VEGSRQEKGNGRYGPQPGEHPHECPDQDAEKASEKGQWLKDHLKAIQEMREGFHGYLRLKKVVHDDPKKRIPSVKREYIP